MRTGSPDNHDAGEKCTPETFFAYSVSGKGSDWRWELMRRGHVVGRGVAGTQDRAYADAVSAALAYTGIAGALHRSSRIAINRSSGTQGCGS
jgi:hypothetical protein